MIHSQMKGSKDKIFNLQDVKTKIFELFLQFIGLCDQCKDIAINNESNVEYFSIYEMVKDLNEDILDKELIKLMCEIYAFGDEYCIESIINDIALKMYLSTPDLYPYVILYCYHNPKYHPLAMEIFRIVMTEWKAITFSDLTIKFAFYVLCDYVNSMLYT